MVSEAYGEGEEANEASASVQASKFAMFNVHYTTPNDAQSLSSSSMNPGMTPTCVARMMYSPFTHL